MNNELKKGLFYATLLNENGWAVKEPTLLGKIVEGAMFSVSIIGFIYIMLLVGSILVK